MGAIRAAVVTSAPRIVLASASPARLRTLRSAGLAPEVVVSGVDESVVTGLPPAETALQLARLKAQAVAARVDGSDGSDGSAYVIGCDSLLELDGEVHGKPASVDEARSRWRRMRGRSGVLHTGHCVIAVPGGVAVDDVGSTTVHFAELDDAEIDRYVATGEPLAVAGAFTVDGLGGAYVRAVEGDHHNVVGISLPLLRRLLGEHGVRWTDLWVAPTP